MTDDKQHLIGTQLGSCVLKQHIGSGGMGMVFLAHQEHLQRDVAIKIMRANMVGPAELQKEFLARFRREAHVIAKLDHVHILPIYEYGEQDGLAYLVMPYLTGGSLHDRLAAGKPLPLETIISYSQQAATALDYAHEHKIIHRDIKPRNILFHADGRLVLVDFGIAHILRDEREKQTGQTLTGSGHFIGSVDYMAPEMVNGKRVYNQTDIYEFGVVLFQMLTGRLPFTGTTPFTIAAQHMHEPPPSLLGLNANLAPALNIVVQKALAKDPADRYASANELAQALQAAASRGSAGRPAPLSSPGIANYSPTQSSLGLFPNTSPPEPTQRAFNVEVPTLQHPPQERVSGIGPRNMPPPVERNSAVNSYPRHTGEPWQYAPPPARKQRRWIATIVSICVVAALLVSGILFVPGVIDRLPIPLPFGSDTQNPTPVPTSTMVPQIPSPTPTISPEQKAKDLLRFYYDEINQRQYIAAYTLWGKEYQASQTEEEFAQGFETTVHDDISISASLPQGDGKVKVELTLYATDKRNGENVVTAYQGYYIIGQENGAWHLLQSSLTKSDSPTPVATTS